LIKQNLKTIKLYWYGKNKIPNAGDYFGKWLLKKMGFNVIFSKEPDILVCGSILGLNDYINANTKIWGVGFNFEEELSKINNPNVFYAVRGKLSLNKLNLTIDIGLGDPGLLLSRFFIPQTKKIYDICLISHYKDYKYFKKKYNDKYFIINMGTNNIEEIANLINKCSFIFSSSLHGIIFSHSLGIPAVHLKYNMLSSKKNFKFKDYYSILDIPYIKEDLNKEDLEAIVKKYDKNRLKYLPKKEIIYEIQDTLLFYFPFQKMNNIICSISKNENEYINSWSKYHLKIGFDNLFIYYYNDKSNDYIGNYIDNHIKKKVHFLKINNKNIEKQKIYYSFFNKFNHKYKWCAYIDINEYFSLGDWNYKSEFLKNFIFKNVSIIKLKAIVYQNLTNRIIKPIIYIFKKINKTHFLNAQEKYIFKGGISHNYFISFIYFKINPHIFFKKDLYNNSSLFSFYFK